MKIAKGCNIAPIFGEKGGTFLNACENTIIKKQSK